MRGRKPDSNTTKRLRGTIRKDRVRAIHRQASDDQRHATDTPSAESLIDASVPPELHGDAIAIAEYQRIASELSRAKIVTPLDRPLLIAAAAEWSKYLRACGQARRDGLTATRGSGGKGVAPAVNVAHRSLTVLLRIWPADAWRS